MSVLGIASTALAQLGNIPSKFQGVQDKFKTLGQDLQAGNLTQAQTDFVTLSQSVTSQLASSSPFAKAFNAVGQALQSGDLSAAQQAFAAIAPGGTAPASVHHHHYRVAMAPSSASAAQSNLFAQELGTLGQALQPGNLTAAQQAFSAMQQGWQLSQASGASGSLLPPVSSGVNVTV
jgi:hypothetical protein